MADPLKVNPRPMLPKTVRKPGSWLLFCLSFLTVSAHAQPLSFDEAKSVARKHVYFDRNDEGTLYCGCPWRWVAQSAGRIDMKACGYEVRAEGQRFRAERIEWEHIVPAFNFGRARQCWQKGGRDYCRSNDPVFNEMSGDLHNLTPTVGEINSDRNNFRFGPLPETKPQHGQCSFRVDFKQRIADPGDRAKGLVARVYFYMHDRYQLPMSERDQRVLMAWDKAYPVSAWELERNKRIEKIIGYSNPFVTGERTWKLGHKSSGESEKNVTKIDYKATPKTIQPIRGNQNSKVYHLPEGCPSYHAMKQKNIVEFVSEGDARGMGYRRARNCVN